MRKPESPPPSPYIPPGEYDSRRARVAEQIGDALLLLDSGTSSSDPRARFRPSSDFFYLTGFGEPEAVLALRGGENASFVMFVRERDPEREVWDGRRSGPEGARKDFGADSAFPIGQLPRELPGLIDGAERLFFRPWTSPRLDGVVRRTLSTLGARERTGARAPAILVDPGSVLHEMRLRKSEAELKLIERAAEISALGHRAALARAAPGVFEFQLQAAIEQRFLDEGAEGPGYATIVGSGENGCVLHYVDNSDPLGEGELVLVDAGATFAGYTADITRTWPVSGRFGSAQLDLYQTVLAAEQAGLAEVRPGGTIDGIHAIVLQTLAEGLSSLGLLEGSADQIVESGDYKRYFMHRTSHWLGIEVHDAGHYLVNGCSRPLEPGMVLTVEPGLYIPPGDERAPAELRGAAVRIEDDAIVTAEGSRVITRSIPVDAGEIAALVSQAAPE